MKAYEVNFDGIVGPTHTYSGLSFGNIPSESNKNITSNPKEAALQGLEKMKFLADLGIKQAVLPPHERPHIPTLRKLGYTGSDEEILQAVEPSLLSAVGSAAAMWTANAATVSPSADTQDRKVHFTPANLVSKFHRSIEAPTTERILKTIFNDSLYFAIHPPLPNSAFFGDEGAANHSRFCEEYESAGIEMFVYGRLGFNHHTSSKKYPARQTLEASQAVGRLHQLNPDHVVFAQQHPDAIDAGAFHNDVVSVVNKNVFFFHEQAFLNKKELIEALHKKVRNLKLIEVPASEISLKDAIESYLFNSQLVSTSDGSMILIAPSECQSNEKILHYLNHAFEKKTLHFINVRQSMQNGGGPACLRLRVVLTEEELKRVNPHVFLNDQLYAALVKWVQKHYRDHLTPKDLADPLLLKESKSALDELTKILHLGPIYDFQRSS